MNYSNINQHFKHFNPMSDFNHIAISKLFICIFLFTSFITSTSKAGDCRIKSDPVDSLKGLKDYYRDYFPIGVSVSPLNLAGDEEKLILKQFNSITPENAMKMGPIHPRSDYYNWGPADRIVSFAGKNGMLVHGHVLCWHSQAPEWIFKDERNNFVSKEVLLERLRQHITAVVTRYKGKVYSWDVVNEAIDDDSTRFYRNSPWFEICGEEYIIKAFEFAHEADPDALLFYNDYNTEDPVKRDKIYTLLKKMLDSGIPVHGVGLQGHWSVYEPSEKNLRDALDKYSSLGLLVKITELDISIYPAEDLRREKRPDEVFEGFTSELEHKQIEQYRMIFNVFREYKNVISGVTFWNISDRHSWLDNFPVRGRKNFPLLFDQNLRPKKAFDAVIDFHAKQNMSGGLIITTNPAEGKFSLLSSGQPTPILICSDDYPGVIRACSDFQQDIKRVTGAAPQIIRDTVPEISEIVLIGSLGKNKLINNLINNGRLDLSGISGQWESYLIQIIDQPFPGVGKALVIAGSDKRGTIYGIYDLSSKIGVSPWYWWADVPVMHKDALYVNCHKYIQGPPAVKYRGIFLNDEAPDLTNWVIENFSMVHPRKNPPIPPGVANYNHEFYSRLFELILRLKGNYLWPAMWNNAFNEDDTENPRLADEYGIVMGTSHQEPMLRAQKEWDRRYQVTLGSWNYAKHSEVLQDFWREGIIRNRNYESIITLGLRGANDTEMAPGGPEVNKTMLEGIVDVQRKILAEEMDTDLRMIPQLWCLYKEVQDYYKAGMRVPEDVTLLWAEDNWGNVRRLPTQEEHRRIGSAGIYYHFDYHGGPRSYQWINTSPIPKIWDQMSLARQYGADRIWIVNVGHFKGYEFPLEYFMNLAWFRDSLRNDNILEYTRSWSEKQFGPEYADEIAEIISKYTKYNGRRKPELLSPTTYSIVNYREAENIVEDFREITRQAEIIYDNLPIDKQEAFYQLILFPTKASALINELYLAAGKNNLYAKQKRASTNDMLNETQRLFRADTSLMGYYNRVFAGGKWNHFMDQAHLGYTTWRDPPVNSLQAIRLYTYEVPQKADMGVSVEGSEEVWPGSRNEATLPEFDVFNQQKYYIDIFNKGKESFEYMVLAGNPWIRIDHTKGTAEKDRRIWVSIDWDFLPTGKNKGSLKVTGTGKEITIAVSAFKPAEINPENLQGFVESNGCISMEAEHFHRNIPSGERRWIRIEDYGHTMSAMRATEPCDLPPAIPGKDSPCLEYRMYLFTTGQMVIEPVFSPTLNFLPDRPLRYGISVDNEEPQVITLVPADYNAQNGNREWEKSVSDNFRKGYSVHNLSNPGYHILRLWMIDPGVVVQKIIVNTGGVKPCYLGPPESFYRSSASLP
jgi:GH35 family endo-1,4-beta-xylanase